MRIFYSYMATKITLDKAIIDYWDMFMEAPKSVVCSPGFHHREVVGRHHMMKVFVETQLLLKDQFYLSSVESIHEVGDYLLPGRNDVTLKEREDGVSPQGPDQEGKDPSSSFREQHPFIFGPSKINNMHTID